MDILVARYAGPCRGIQRAVRVVERYVAQNGPGSVVTYGPLVEQPELTESLVALGVRVVESVSEIRPGQAVAVPVHGLGPEEWEQVRASGAPMLTTVCDPREKAQRIAYKLARQGYPVLVLGPADDPDVARLLDWVEKGWRESLVVLGGRADRVFAGCAVDQEHEDLPVVPEDVEHVALVAGPVASLESLQKVAARAVGRFDEVRVYNTVCPAVALRVQEALKLAERCDLVVVVGRRDGPVTRLLVSEARRAGGTVHQVTGVADVGGVDLEGVTSVGVVASCDVATQVFVATVEALRKAQPARLDALS